MHVASRINVVHMTQYLDVGGLETFIMELCYKTRKDQFNLSVLCLNGYDEKYKIYLEGCGVAVNLIRKKSKCDASFFLEAAKWIKRNNTTVIHSHSGCFFYSAVIARLANAGGLLYTAHGMPVNSGLRTDMEDFISCASANRIVAVSEEIAADLQNRQPFFRDKIEVITNGIDTSKFCPVEHPNTVFETKALYGLPQTKKIIGSVGRLESVKNHAMLLNACAELVHVYHDDFHLAIVGCGSEEASLRNHAVNLDIGEKVSFLGMQYDLPKLYHVLDVFVLSSLTEGTSISLLEAQSCGIPAVVTDVGGNSHVIADGVNGYLCPSGDPAAMAAKLDRLLNDDADLLHMKTSARKTVVREFNMDLVVEKYQRIYRDIAQVSSPLTMGRP